MRLFFLIGCFYLLVILSSCRDSDKVNSDNLLDHTPEDKLELRRYEQNRLKTLYNSYEKQLREDGVSEQNKIDATIQIMIDEGDLTTPYVYENDSSERKFLTYIEYKNHITKHPLDTNSVYTFSLPKKDSVPVDSMLIKLLSDSLP